MPPRQNTKFIDPAIRSVEFWIDFWSTCDRDRRDLIAMADAADQLADRTRKSTAKTKNRRLTQKT